MPIDVQMPDGTIISGVPDNVTQSDLLKRYQAYTPPAQNAAVPDELGRYDAAKQGNQPFVPTGQKEATIGSQFMGGVKQAGSDYGTFVESLASQEAANQAAIARAKRQEEIQREVGHVSGSKEVGQASKEKGFPMTNFGDLRYTAWGGGVPVLHQGKTIGAVGVSGLPEEEDMAMARMGAGLIG